MTDSDCGLFVKGEHKRQFAYEAHTACDKNGFILEAVVTPGNVHDSVAFNEVYDTVTESFPQAAVIVVDSAYKTPHICKKGIVSTAYKRPQTMKRGHEWWKYVYDEYKEGDFSLPEKFPRRSAQKTDFCGLRKNFQD